MAGERNRESLPKWAQQELHRLERDLESWRSRATAGPEDSDTFLWGGGIGGEHDKPLGRRAQILFRFGKRWHDEFQVQLKGEELWINGGDGLAVLPHSSNVVKLRIQR
jgi:hypothetical protein